MRLVCLFLIFALAAVPLDATLSKSDKKKKKKVVAESAAPPAESLVTDRGLVTENPNYKQILQSHSSYSAAHAKAKLFPHTTLAYVTPWHSRGYDHAKTFAAKFSLVSPVWLQLRPAKTDTGFTITGGHDIDMGWIRDVKKNSKVSMVPRVIFEGWTSGDFHRLFSNQYVANGCTQTIVDFLVQRSFDGVVLEVWSMLGGQRNDELVHLVRHLASDLHSAGLLLVLVIPPAVVNNQLSPVFGKREFDALSGSVDYFSLMTYDFAQHSQQQQQQQMPNAPIQWLRQCVEALVPEHDDRLRSKILLGLAFYGYDQVPGNMEPVIGNKYLELLKKHRPSLVWNDQYKEHFVEYSTGIGSHVMNYPTLASVHYRLALARSLGTGVSIWEIGQGLDYFFDLL